LSTVAVSAGLAATLILLFVLCGVVEMFVSGLQVSHAWIAIFTAAPVNSVRAWVEGLLASLVFGWIAGTIFALTYNAVTGRE
jgi:hypothetical protein